MENNKKKIVENDFFKKILFFFGNNKMLIISLLLVIGISIYIYYVTNYDQEFLELKDNYSWRKMLISDPRETDVLYKKKLIEKVKKFDNWVITIKILFSVAIIAGITSLISIASLITMKILKIEKPKKEKESKDIKQMNSKEIEIEYLRKLADEKEKGIVK